jgi:hypothetical protein
MTYRSSSSVIFDGLGIARPLLGILLRENVVAEGDALVADEDARTADQLADFATPLATEGAVKVVH